MSLLQDIKDWYSEEVYPPDGVEVDAKQISYEYGNSRRWGMEVHVVYQRGEELVLVTDIEPATEYQSWGDYGAPVITLAEAYDVTVTRYRPLDNAPVV